MCRSLAQDARPDIRGHTLWRHLMKVVLAESVAMMAIGDGVLGVLFPVQHSTRWEFGPSRGVSACACGLTTLN